MAFLNENETGLSKEGWKLTRNIAVALIVFMVAFGSIFIVSVGKVGVTFNRITGTTKSYSQGLHFKLPLIVSITKFDVRTQRIDITAESASKDLQKVVVHVALNYHLVYDKVNELFVNVGKDFGVRVIEPAVNESVKASTAKFPVEQIITNREELRLLIEKSLGERFAPYFLKLESLNLINIAFDEEFNKVVEQKQIEEQKIKTAEYQKRQAMELKEKTILEAEGESRKQELLRQSTSKEVIDLKWIEKWNGVLPTIVTGDKGMVLVTPK